MPVYLGLYLNFLVALVAVPYRCRIYSYIPYGREKGGMLDIDAVT